MKQSLTPQIFYDWAKRNNAEDYIIEYKDENGVNFNVKIDVDTKLKTIVFQTTHAFDKTSNEDFDDLRQYKKVTYNEYRRFISDYPRPLDCHLNTIWEPPLLIYIDHAIKLPYPYNMVACGYIYENDPKQHYYTDPYSASWSILVNYKEVYKKYQTGGIK